MIIAVGLALAVLASAPGPASDPGGAAAQELARRLPPDELRREVGQCLRRALAGPRRRYGAFEFSLVVSSGEIRIETADRRMEDTRRCLARALGGRLADWPGSAEISLRVRVEPGREDDFGLQWSLPLPRPPLERAPEPLPGAFETSGDRARSACVIGNRRLVLEMMPSAPDLAPPRPAPNESVLEAIRCRCQPPPGAKQPAVAARNCLWASLRHPDPAVRAAAAEEVAQRRYPGSRRRLREALDALAGALPASGLSEEEGLALARQARALLSLGEPAPPPVWAALAGHPSRDVRLQALECLADRSRRTLPEGAEALLSDADPGLRLRACEVACRAGDARGAEALFSLLERAPADVRAEAALSAPACLRLVGGRARSFVEAEPETPVALLWLERMFAPPPELVRSRALAALEGGCPAARWLAARLLQGLPRHRLESVPSLLLREKDERIREELQRLLGDNPNPNRCEAQRLWIEPAQ